MSTALALYRSSLGKKYIMAVTGIIGFGYVLGHMIGNLQAFPALGGAEGINAYAHFLHHGSHGLIWVARAILLAAVLLHILAAYQLTQMSHSARPSAYEKWDPVAANYASRTMRWTGPLLALFIIYHILHLTYGTVHPNFVEGDVYNNLIDGFRVWYVSAFYIICMLALGLHLYHGLWSMFQSLGWNTPQYDALLHKFAVVFTILIVVGFISVPIGVLTGMIA